MAGGVVAKGTLEAIDVAPDVLRDQTSRGVGVRVAHGIHDGGVPGPRQSGILSLRVDGDERAIGRPAIIEGVEHPPQEGHPARLVETLVKLRVELRDAPGIGRRSRDVVREPGQLVQLVLRGVQRGIAGGQGGEGPTNGVQVAPTGRRKGGDGEHIVGVALGEAFPLEVLQRRGIRRATDPEFPGKVGGNQRVARGIVRGHDCRSDPLVDPRFEGPIRVRARAGLSEGGAVVIRAPHLRPSRRRNAPNSRQSSLLGEIGSLVRRFDHATVPDAFHAEYSRLDQESTRRLGGLDAGMDDFPRSSCQDGEAGVSWA